MNEAGGRRGGAILSGTRAAVLAGLLAVLVDLNGLPGTFIADDVAAVAGNPLVAQCDVRAIFTTDYWGAGTNSGLYRPLTVLTFALNRLVFGPEPWSFHLVNVLAHAGVTFFFARTLIALGFGTPLVFLAGALFAVHPIHADVVNVIVGRAELLVALFLFAGIWLALTRGRRSWPLVLACYGAALLSKEHAIVFLPLLVAADAFVAGDHRRFWRARWPLYALLLAGTAGWLLLRQLVFAAAPVSPHLLYPADNPLLGAAPLTRLLTAAHVNLRYLLNLAFPLWLQSLYSGRGLVVVDRLLSPWGLASLVYGALCAAALVRGWKSRSGFGFGIALYLIGFTVTANLFFLITVLMADRLAYLPAAGFCLAAAALLLSPLQRAPEALPTRAGLLLPLGYALFLTALTLGRNAAFQDPEGFWRGVVAADSGNVRAWLFLSQAAGEQGKIAAAEQALLGAIAAAPDFPDSHSAYSLFLLEQGRPAEAADAARAGIAAAPQGVGLAQFALARASLQLGRPAEALALFDEVSPMFSESFDYRSSRAQALDLLGRSEEAVAAYRGALALRDDGGTRWRLAVLLLRRQRYRESEEVVRALLTRQPTASAHNLLGVSLALQGRSEEALHAFQTAIALDPSAEQYRANREKAVRRLPPLVP